MEANALIPGCHRSIVVCFDGLHRFDTGEDLLEEAVMVGTVLTRARLAQSLLQHIVEPASRAISVDR